jgi:antirestriction protein ArdC
VLINNTPISKEREMSGENRVEWTKLLEQAISEPGKINEAYRRFQGYSLGNRLWAMCQCVTRGIEPSPLASFNRWKELSRHVKKGERALSLCMPVTRKRSQADRDGNEIEITYQFFVLKKNWFVLSQTEGADYTPDPIPNWDEQRALSILNISKVPFDLLNGNVQGYAAPDRKVSVSPLAAQPFKTLFHEIAHQILGHVQPTGPLTDEDATPRSVQEVEAESVAMLCCASLGLPGVEYSRDYIQSWAEGQPISEQSAHRIFAAADKILRAGVEALSKY